jgi:hypothetical protein
MAERIKGRFAPGQSGNPGGKPRKDRGQLRELFKAHKQEALETLLEVMRNGSNKDRTDAAHVILAYGFGKPAAMPADEPINDLLEKKLAAEVQLLEQKLASSDSNSDGVTQEDAAVAAKMRERFGEAETYDGGDEPH